jgi:amino acid permease
MFRFEEFFYLYVAIPLFLGLYLTYAGFKSSSPSPAVTMDSDRSRRS